MGAMSSTSTPPLGRYAFLSFYALAWLIPVLLLGSYVAFPQAWEFLHGAPVDLGALVAGAEAEAGVRWSSNLLDLTRLCVAEPLLWILVLASATPAVAALIAAPALLRRAGLRALLGRLRPWCHIPWRQGLALYAVIVAMMVLILLSMAALRFWLGGEVRAGYRFDMELPSFAFALALLTGALLDQGAVLEELGWRGWGQPVLQAKTASPLLASLVVGVAWSLWHLPRDFGFGLMSELGPDWYWLLYLPLFTANCVLQSIVIAYFFNRTGGSVLVAIVIHGLANDAAGISGARVAGAGPQFAIVHQATIVVVLAIAAAGILWRAGTALGLRRDVDDPATP